MNLNNHGEAREKLALIRAINRLKQTNPAEWAVLIAALELEDEELTKNLRSAEGLVLHRSQGAALFLDAMLEVFATSEAKQTELLKVTQAEQEHR